ncbi:MAG: class I SAM-dependent methyltransferase [Bacteroidales bacterium]|nr:class I SAM-dependent methyltransferase [Bacteroidales bacterium]
MNTVEESVVIAMDGLDSELFNYLPYILQDMWEIGANPVGINDLIRENFDNPAELKVLDLGCGKGAISVKASKALGCFCHGIDAIPQFIDYANEKAIEFQVDDLCKFEVGDIREKVKTLRGFDVVILGAIGPVFGNYLETLSILKQCLNDSGVIITDDAYIEDESSFSHPLMLKKSDVLKQIADAGFVIITKVDVKTEDIQDADDLIFNNLKKRCLELIEKHPGKEELFRNYILKQEEETYVLENKVTAYTMMLKSKL